MLGMTWGTVAVYCVFSGLLFYVQKHAVNFQGDSQAIGGALSIVALLGLLLQFGFLGCVWWQHSFLTMAALFGLSIASSIVFVAAEVSLRLPIFVFSMLGLVATLPLAAASFYLLLR